MFDLHEKNPIRGHCAEHDLLDTDSRFILKIFPR